MTFFDWVTDRQLLFPGVARANKDIIGSWSVKKIDLNARIDE
jgi:hypothetical protein